MMKRSKLTIRVVDNYNGKSHSFVVEEGTLAGAVAAIKNVMKKSYVVGHGKIS